MDGWKRRSPVSEKTRELWRNRLEWTAFVFVVVLGLGLVFALASA
jgi:hypothetical protein